MMVRAGSVSWVSEEIGRDGKPLVTIQKCGRLYEVFAFGRKLRSWFKINDALADADGVLSQAKEESYA